jgi:hypothetical protein
MMKTFNEQIAEAIETRQNSLNKIREYANQYNTQIGAIEAVFKPLGEKIIQIKPCSNSLDINIAGGKGTLKKAFKYLRQLGYKPRSRPTEKLLISFETYFDHPDHEFRIWLAFTSTKCTRKVVGTEMRPVAVYETICE